MPTSVEQPASIMLSPGIVLLEAEPRWKRFIYGVLAVLLSFGFLFVSVSYLVPAHGGVDQNGYLVGGKMFAKNLTMRLSPIRPGTQTEFDPHQFVGRMWVGADETTPDERYYPKYPLGLPALYAVMLWIGSLGGKALGPQLAYWVSPVCMSLAVLGTYLLGRRLAGSFGGLLASIIFATSPVTLQLSFNPNSHASCVCFVVWGMYLLFCWWERRGVWRAVLAGFLLGYAATIRYSEATLLLPLGLMAVYGLNWRNPRSWKESAALVAGWMLPVGLLVLYNHAAMGTNTGYDPTNESTGFRWQFGSENWETMLRQLNTNGVALIFPPAIAGLVWMFWWNWRAASVMATWIVPCLLTYTFYYWAPDNNNAASYLRFFETILPALAICFFWLMSRLSVWAMLHDHHSPRRILTAWIVPLAGVAGFIATAGALGHAWLDDHDPAIVHVDHANWIARHLTPALPASPDLGSRVSAIGELESAGLGALAAGTAAALIALAVTRGRATLPTVGAGLVGGVVVAMHLSNSLPWMEADQFNRYQLQLKSDAVREAVPEGSIIFCQDESLLLNLQFFGDYDLYDGRSLRYDLVQQLPNAEPPDQPQGLDPHRRDGLYKRLRQFDQKGLDEQARRIISDALASNRRAFFVIPGKPVNVPPRKIQKLLRAPPPAKPLRLPEPVMRICLPERFDTDVASFWPGYVSRPTQPVAGKPRGARMDRPVDQPAVRQPVQIIEVTRHVATPAPAAK